MANLTNALPVKKPTEELRDPIVKPAASINNITTTTETKSSSSTEPTQVDVTPTTTTISTHTDDSNLTTESTELKDLIINKKIQNRTIFKEPIDPISINGSC